VWEENYRVYGARKVWKAAQATSWATSKLATPPELEAARKSLQSFLGIVRVDRNGIGYPDLSIGVHINVVAGARFGNNLWQTVCLLTIARGT
jgi:hypothetical protein